MSTITVTQDERAERRERYHEADVVVVGAGVFGCAIAFALANQGRSVLLLERWLKEPDRIVGELLQPGGVEALKKLGLEKCLEGIDAIPCHGYDVIYHGSDVVIPYPTIEDLRGYRGVDFEEKLFDSKLPVNHSVKTPEKGTGPRPQGRGFHHGRFIMNLRRACMKNPNITVVETEAVSTVQGDNKPDVLGVEARTVDQATGEKKSDFFFGKLTIVADGYASKFRKQYMSVTPVVKSKFYALELIDCPLPHKGYGHVIIGNASPVLLYQIGTHETRALIDVPEKCEGASVANGGVRGYIKNVVIPGLPEQVQPCFEAALQKNSGIPKSMPNSWLPPTKQTTHPGMVILGDAMNMRHPLTGGGMTVCFNDAVLLADLLSPWEVPELSDTRAVGHAMSRFHWQRKSLSAIINVLALALYSLFSGADPNLVKLQRGCFAYFQRGITDDPMGLLGGLIHDPLVLAWHFFAVAFLAIWIDAKRTGLWKLPVVIWNAFGILFTACVVFLPVMYKELC